MSTDEKLKIGLRIKEFRTDVINKTQADLAKDLSMTQKSISNYENGLVFPETKFFDKMQAKYGADPVWLQTGSGARSLTNAKVKKGSAEDKLRVLEGKLALLENRLSSMEGQVTKLVEILERVAADVKGQ